MSPINFKAKYTEYINLVKSIPKDSSLSLEMIPCIENRVFLRVCVFPAHTTEKIFYLLEVLEVKGTLPGKIWVPQYEFPKLKKVKGKKDSFVTFSFTEKIMLVKCSEEYGPQLIYSDTEGEEYEKTRIDTVQTLTVTKELYGEIKKIWPPARIVGTYDHACCVVEVIDGEINIISTNGHVMIIRNTGIKCSEPLNFSINADVFSSMSLPYWDHEKSMELKLSEMQKSASWWECNLLICQKGKGKILFPKKNVYPVKWQTIVENTFDYGSITAKLPLIPKDIQAIDFTWERNGTSKSKLSMQQRFFRTVSEEELNMVWVGEANVLMEDAKFASQGLTSIQWRFNRALFGEGVQLTNENGIVNLSVGKESDMTVGCCKMVGNGYDFYIMPLNL